MAIFGNSQIVTVGDGETQKKTVGGFSWPLDVLTKPEVSVTGPAKYALLGATCYGGMLLGAFAKSREKSGSGEWDLAIPIKLLKA